MIDSSHLISLLEEDDTELQIAGLEGINAHIEHIWHEVSENIPLIESLSEQEPSSELSNLASIVLSKLYFHLGQLEESLAHALHSGDYFAPTSKDEFSSTLLQFCIDKYIALRTKNESTKSYFKTAPRLSLSSSSGSLTSSLLSSDDADVSTTEKRQAFSTSTSSSSKQKNISSKQKNNSSTLLASDDDDDVVMDDDEEEEKEEVPTQEMENIVEKIVRKSVSEGDDAINLSIGLSIDCRRDDLITELLEQGGRSALEYCRHLVMDEKLYIPLEFRVRVIKLLEKHYREGAMAGNKGDFFALVRCLVALTKPQDVAELLIALTDGKCENINDGVEKRKVSDGELIALQMAFDLASKEPQKFLHKVLESVKNHMKTLIIHENDGETKKKEEEGTTSTTTETTTEEKKKESAVVEKYKKLMSALSGNSVNDLGLDFLYSANHSDMYLISYIKMIADSQSKVGKDTGNFDVVRDATLISNALMHSGTSVDVFVRKNIDWLAKAKYWSIFTATAGLGVIHRGHHKHAFKLLGVYLPTDDMINRKRKAQKYYSEGGALFALGLIHADNGAAAVDYLKNALEHATMGQDEGNEMVLHGCCLGLGLAALATADHALTERLWEVVIQHDGTTPQEAAALAIGLVNIGSNLSENAESMLTYARETQHDRVARFISLALALSCYGRQESADTMVETMTSDKNPDIRFGGMYAIGLAYCGTSANNAISRLLGAAVSDVSDDVRRAALVSLGFVLLKSPESCPHLVALLTDSFNPHVRYGAAMALGISCAGTALNEAIALLEPMMNDPIDFVRQGAMIAIAMVLIQASPAEVPKLEKIKGKMLDKITNPREEVMSKMGAILATGIINAGGRNVAIARDGFKAVAGLVAFSLYWYWFPCAHFITLAFTPTAVITLDQTLQKVSLKLKSNAPPSMYAYPENMKAANATNAGKETVTSVLSYGKNQAQKRLDASRQMEVEDEEKEKKKKEEEEEAKKKEKEEEEDEKKKKKEKKEEAKFEILETPCRVTPRQKKVVKFEPDDRYIPVKESGYYGIVIVRDVELDKPDVVDDDDDDIIIESGGEEEKKKKGSEGLKARPEGTRKEAVANADGNNDGGDKKGPVPPAPFTLSDDD